MKNKSQQHLILSIIFALIVGSTLLFMHDNFMFQTFGGVIYFDYLLSGSNDEIKVENIEAYLDQDNFYLNGGSITINNEITDPVSFKLKLTDKEDDYEVALLDISLENKTYQLEDHQITVSKFPLAELEKANLEVISNEKQIAKLDLKINRLDHLEGANKEYRIENAAISKTMIRLGSLKTSNKDIFKKYPNASLEYRYLKNPDGDKEDNDNYVVFNKIVGTSKELINSNDYGTYQFNEDIDLSKKELSVVVILSNDKDKYVFAIDLDIQKAGDYYE